MKFFNFLSLIFVFLLGCASTGVIPMDAGTYMIAQKSAQLGFGEPIGVKANVYKEANDFCSTQNKQVETIDLQVRNSYPATPGRVSLTFRCK